MPIQRGTNPKSNPNGKQKNNQNQGICQGFFNRCKLFKGKILQAPFQNKNSDSIKVYCNMIYRKIKLHFMKVLLRMFFCYVKPYMTKLF